MATRTTSQEHGRRRGTVPGGDGSATEQAVAADGGRDYVVPIVHVHLPERAVDAAFWGGLAGAAALGVVDLPLAALVGGAVLVARHRARAAA